MPSALTIFNIDDKFPGTRRIHLGSDSSVSYDFAVLVIIVIVDDVMFATEQQRNFKYCSFCKRESGKMCNTGNFPKIQVGESGVSCKVTNS